MGEWGGEWAGQVFRVPGGSHGRELQNPRLGVKAFTQTTFSSLTPLMAYSAAVDDSAGA